MLGVRALFDLFETRDIDAILVKLDELGARPKWVSGWGDQRSFVVYVHRLPEEWRQQACEAADRDDGWRGYLDRP